MPREHGPTLPGILGGFLLYATFLGMVWLLFAGVLAVADYLR
jgi:hypothetical protein